MNRLIHAAAVGTAAAIVLVAGAVAPAIAAGTPPVSPAPRSLADIQAAGAKQTSERTASLTTAISKVTASTQLSSADRTTILATLNGDLTGMSAVASAIAADSTVKQASAHFKSIFTTYRVYAVALPQAHFAAAADGLEASAIPKLTAAQQKLSAALAGKYAAKSTPALQAALADMATQIATAQTSLSGLAATALAATPAAYNANHAVLTPVRQSLATAAAAIKRARSDAKTVLAALK
ncbi:MAG: hypothetical protein ACOH1Y_11970 [Propionicimonas sp.]